MIGELRKGKEVIRQTAEGGKAKGKITPYISWKKGEAKSVYFITPIEEVPKVLMHNFVRKYVETDDGRQERWLTFMCRKDPAWLSESGGECPLCDDIGHPTQERFVALAVEVEPVYEGKRATGVNIKYRTAKDKDGNEVDYPQVGLVIQSSKNFFNTLVALDQKRDISDNSWEVTREGEGFNTKYIFYPIEHKPDLSTIDEFIPSLRDLLENLGSMERYERELEGVNSDDQPTFGEGKTTSNLNSADTDVFKELRERVEKKKLESY